MSTGLEQQLRFFFLLTMPLIVQIKEVCPLIRGGLYIHIYNFNLITFNYIYQTLLSKATYSAFRLYMFLSVHVFPGNRTHNLCAANAML